MHIVLAGRGEKKRERERAPPIESSSYWPAQTRTNEQTQLLPFKFSLKLIHYLLLVHVTSFPLKFTTLLSVASVVLGSISLVG